MTDKELRKLGRISLLELLLAEREENEQLRKKLEQAEGEPEERIPEEKTPENAQLEAELERVRYHRKYRDVIRSTLCTLITVAAIAVLIAVFLLPVFRIQGHSMTPGLDEGQLVVSVKGTDFQTGDVIAFYYNNKILVKRVIAQAGDWINFDEDGTVYVNQEKLDEPYISEQSMGTCDIDLPFQVPEGRLFVMGDHRSVSVDSRNTMIGCVSEEQIVGKLVLKIWPLDNLGRIE